MIAALNNFAMVYDKNLIGIANCIQTVSHDKTGTVGHVPLERLLYQLFGCGIDTGGSPHPK